MLNPKLLYLAHLIGKTDSLEKTLMLGKIEGKRRTRWQRMTWLNSITDLMNMNFSKLRNNGEQRSLVFYSPGSHKELNSA